MSTNEFENAVAARLAPEAPAAVEEQPAAAAPVAPVEQPVVEETTTPAEETPAAAVVEETPEEMRARIEALEKRVADKEQMIGRQTTELGELRRVREEVEQLKGRVEAPKYDYDALIDQDPSTAAQLAYETGDAYHLQAALNAWKEDDPFAAAVWYTSTKNQAELAQVTQHYEARLGVHDAGAAQQELGGVMATFAQANPDLETIAPAMLEVAKESPQILALMQSGDAQTKIEVFDYLATKARGRLGAATPAVASPAADEAAAAAAAAKQGGAALTAVGGGPAPDRTTQTAGDAAVEIKSAFREHFGLTPLS